MKRILVAGIGNAWLSDDGFGGEVVRRLEQRELPEGAVVLDFGTGGLDLAYEVMRGYDALVLVDVSRQGGEPGTLYVMEASEEEVEAGIEDGQVINPHAMDPQTVLRFVKTVGAWPGKVATIERILVAYDDRVHLGVTVDDDPGADLLRDTGRFLYFFPEQVEHVA